MPFLIRSIALIMWVTGVCYKGLHFVERMLGFTY